MFFADYNIPRTSDTIIPGISLNFPAHDYSFLPAGRGLGPP